MASVDIILQAVHGEAIKALLAADGGNEAAATMQRNVRDLEHSTSRFVANLKAG